MKTSIQFATDDYSSEKRGHSKLKESGDGYRYCKVEGNDFAVLLLAVSSAVKTGDKKVQKLKV